MLPNKPDYADTVQRLFPEPSPLGGNKKVITFTFQVTTDCSLRCTYCYQINKGHQMMSWDIAKATIDYIFNSAEEHDSILSYDRNSGLVIDFIGGEPLMNIDLIEKIVDYCETQFVERESPWLFTHRYSFSTNGVAYFDDRVQALLSKYHDLISMSVTVDGHKELHDKCRLFPNGNGSYDYAIKASLDQKDRFNNDATKITLCPENIEETDRAVINMLNLGYRHIFANCVFEEGWTIEHARILYRKMKTIADYILDNNIYDECAVSLFDDNAFSPMSSSDTENWCGGTGDMLAVDYKGDFYPCLRYMETSIGTKYPPLIIGNIKDGAYETEPTRKIKEELDSITRQSQSEEKCLNCPVAKGCAWCSGYNYQVFGTANKRATFICIMHKARSLANYYYWKKEAEKKSNDCKLSITLPRDEAVEIIGQDEWNYLLSL